MINLDLGTLIDKPIKDVFAFVANPNNMSRWKKILRASKRNWKNDVYLNTKYTKVTTLAPHACAGKEINP